MPLKRSGEKEKGPGLTVDRIDVAGPRRKRNGEKSEGREARD